jgi:hypothetical protein
MFGSNPIDSPGLGTYVAKSYDADGNITGLAGSGTDTYDGIQTVGVSPPSTAITAAVGSAGALTGAYYYNCTFVTSKGETETWAGLPTVVNPSSQRVNLSAIPVSTDSRVTARKIYRCPAVTGSVDPRDFKLVATISDNTTTTYVDNTADGSLGANVPWISGTMAFLAANGVRCANFLGETTAIGEGAFLTGTGYASVAIGYQSLLVNTTGKRNTAVGVYTLTANTTGYANSAFGTHAGDSVTTGAENTLIGYDAGPAITTGNFNTAVGGEAFNAGTGSLNVAVGYVALGSINSADQCIGIGYSAGRYANASRQLFIDNVERSNIGNAQDIGLIYGKGESTAIAQRLNFNALVRVGPPSLTVSSLPAATGLAGYCAFVTDANATTFASIVAGGGSNGVPVYCDGTNWRIG